MQREKWLNPYVRAMIGPVSYNSKSELAEKSRRGESSLRLLNFYKCSSVLKNKNYAAFNVQSEAEEALCARRLEY